MHKSTPLPAGSRLYLHNITGDGEVITDHGDRVDVICLDAIGEPGYEGYPVLSMKKRDIGLGAYHENRSMRASIPHDETVRIASNLVTPSDHAKQAIVYNDAIANERHQARDAINAKKESDKERGLRIISNLPCTNVCNEFRAQVDECDKGNRYILNLIHQKNTSDPYTDYHGHKIESEICIAFVAKRVLFKSWKKALKHWLTTTGPSAAGLTDEQCGRLQVLAENGKENRENWSMGRGYYITEPDMAHGDSSGFVLRSRGASRESVVTAIGSGTLPAPVAIDTDEPACEPAINKPRAINSASAASRCFVGEKVWYEHAGEWTEGRVARICSEPTGETYAMIQVNNGNYSRLVSSEPWQDKKNHCCYKVSVLWSESNIVNDMLCLDSKDEENERFHTLAQVNRALRKATDYVVKRGGGYDKTKVVLHALEGGETSTYEARIDIGKETESYLFPVQDWIMDSMRYRASQEAGEQDLINAREWYEVARRAKRWELDGND